MKTSFLAALVVAGLGFVSVSSQAHAQAGGAGGGAALLTGVGGPQPGPNSFVIKAISPLAPKTPEYNTQANDSQSKKYTVGTWLQIDVEFTSAVRVAELTFHYNVLIGGALLVGDQTLVDVSPGTAGGSLFTTVFIAPRTIATLLRGAPFTANSVQNINVQILRPGVAQPLASKTMREGGGAFYTTMQQVSGFVLNKAQTPFAPLWYDHYEVIKDPPLGR